MDVLVGGCRPALRRPTRKVDRDVSPNSVAGDIPVIIEHRDGAGGFLDAGF